LLPIVMCFHVAFYFNEIVFKKDMVKFRIEQLHVTSIWSLNFVQGMSASLLYLIWRPCLITNQVNPIGFKLKWTILHKMQLLNWLHVDILTENPFAYLLFSMVSCYYSCHFLHSTRAFSDWLNQSTWYKTHALPHWLFWKHMI
jgi:hypothetical protein